MDGFQVLQALRSDPSTIEIPVVMLTAKGSVDHMRLGWQKGADFYMPKPFNPAELRSVVDRLAAVAGTPENPAPLRRPQK
jgi:DNA-binding response OmpR family regulator